MATFSGAIKQTIAKFNISSLHASAGTVLATCPDNATMDVEIQGVNVINGSSFARYLEIQTYDQQNNAWRGTSGAASAAAYGVGGVWPKGIVTQYDGNNGTAGTGFWPLGWSADSERQAFGRFSPEHDRTTDGTSTKPLKIGDPIRLYPNERLVMVGGGGDADAYIMGITNTKQSAF